MGTKEERKQKANKQALQHLHQQGEQASQQWGLTHLGAKGDHFQHEEHQEGLDPEREMKSPMDFEEFRDLAKYGCISWGAS